MFQTAQWFIVINNKKMLSKILFNNAESDGIIIVQQ